MRHFRQTKETRLRWGENRNNKNSTLREQRKTLKEIESEMRGAWPWLGLGALVCMGQKDRRICQTCRSNQSAKSLSSLCACVAAWTTLLQWADLYYLCSGSGPARVRLFTWGGIWMRRWKWGNFRVQDFDIREGQIERTQCRGVSQTGEGLGSGNFLMSCMGRLNITLFFCSVWFFYVMRSP